jgi:hypothetical protein
VRTVTVRSGGYIALCSGYAALLLVVSVGAFLDPTLKGTGDPDWMFWVDACGLLAFLIRAPFVGLVIRGDRVTHRTWLRSRSWPVGDVTRVDSAGYSGMLNRGSRSNQFRMIVLTVGGSTKEIPEVSGRRRKTEHRRSIVWAALHQPAPSAGPIRTVPAGPADSVRTTGTV